MQTLAQTCNSPSICLVNATMDSSKSFLPMPWLTVQAKSCSHVELPSLPECGVPRPILAPPKAASFTVAVMGYVHEGEKKLLFQPVWLLGLPAHLSYS